MIMAFGQKIEFAHATWGGASLAPGYGEHGLRPIRQRLRRTYNCRPSVRDHDPSRVVGSVRIEPFWIVHWT